MKKINIFFAILVLGTSCTDSPSASISVSVLADKTDSWIPRPNSKHIQSFLEDLRYANGRREFRFQTITHTNINESFSAILPEADRFGNSLQYKADVGKFYKKIDTLLKNQSEKSEKYRNSSILKPLVAKLQELQTSNATRKVLLLYSDVLEASDVFNVYQKKNQRLLLNNPQKVVEIIQSQITIPKLENVELYIIYYPTDTINNRLFEKMVYIFKELFKSSELKIKVGIENRISLK